MQFDPIYVAYLCASYLIATLSASYSGYMGELFVDLIETRYDVRSVVPGPPRCCNAIYGTVFVRINAPLLNKRPSQINAPGSAMFC